MPAASGPSGPARTRRTAALARASSSATSCNGLCGSAVIVQALSPPAASPASSGIATFRIALVGDARASLHPGEGRRRRLSGATTSRGGRPTVDAMSIAIEAHRLTKRYGGTVAVDDLSFTVQSGRVTG